MEDLGSPIEGRLDLLPRLMESLLEQEECFLRHLGLLLVRILDHALANDGGERVHVGVLQVQPQCRHKQLDVIQTLQANVVSSATRRQSRMAATDARPRGQSRIEAMSFLSSRVMPAIIGDLHAAHA